MLYDELFYAYLVWSLRDYTIRYYQGYLAEKNNMLFNIACYIDESFLRRYDNWKYLFYKLRNNVSDLYHSGLSQALKDEILASSGDGLEYDFFNVEATNYIPTDEKGHYDAEFGSPMFSFDSPNQNLFTRGQPITPSPLGKYYFELSDNKDIFIEFFDRIYPSITNPPKGWSKEMMRKLDLKLE